MSIVERPKSLTDLATERLRSLIVHGDLPLGSPFEVIDLCHPVRVRAIEWELSAGGVRAGVTSSVLLSARLSAQTRGRYW